MKKIILFLFITISIFTLSIAQPDELTVDDMSFFPEDIFIVNDVAYVSSLGDGTIRSFDLTQSNPTTQMFAEAEAGYTQGWGLKSDGTILLSLLNNADFTGGPSGSAKLVEYDIASAQKTGEWDLPAGAIGHTVSIVEGKYYVTDFGSPRIFEIDPATGTVNDSWFTSSEWDPSISGIGGTIYDNNGGFYISQGNKMWYLPISGGVPGTLQEVAVSGLDAIDADGITWVESQNTLYYATNDTGDPANVGTVYKLVFSNATTATGSVIATGFDDSSGLWYYENDGNEYIYLLESQFGALFGINSFEPPFNIEIIELESSTDKTVSVYNSFEDATLTGGQQAFYGAAGPTVISDDVEFPQFINFYDIDVTDFGLTMTLFNNSDAADLLLPDGRFDRYYFAFDEDMSNVNISGGSPGLTAGASVTPLPAGYTLPLEDLFGTGYPLPVTLPNGGFVLELGGGTDLTELGQTISVDFGFSGVSVYNSFEDATLTGGQQAFYGAAGPTVISDDVEFPQFINFYDIDVNDCGLTMTLFNNSDAADLLLPDGRFDRYYFALEQDMSNVSISGGAPGLTVGASVTPLPAGYTLPLEDLFGTGYPLPVTLPNGGFVLELGGGTNLTELGQTISVDFGCPEPESLIVDDNTFFPEDIVIANDVAYVSGLGDGTIRYFDLTQTNPSAQLFAEAEAGYTQRWGVKVAGTKLLSILNNADFAGGMSGPAKLVEYDIASMAKTGEWDLPAGSIGHTVSIVDGKYYVTDFGNPRIFEIDPATGTVNDNWFTSSEWDPTISGIGGTIYNNNGGFYVSQGNKLWYLPISNGMPGTIEEVTVSGLDAIDADGISWVDSQNTLYYATNDTGDPADVGTVYKLVFSDETTAVGSVVATGFDDSSGLWYREKDGIEYIYLLESQFGALFGINSFEPPFNIEVIELSGSASGADLNLELTVTNQLYEQYTAVNYVFTVTNEGDATATNSVVDASLPEGLVYTSHNTANGELDLYLGEWSIPTLAPGETAMLHLALFSLVADQDITYYAEIVASDQTDADSTPNNGTGEVLEDDESAVTITPQSGGGFGTNSGNNDLELNITTNQSNYGIYEVVPYTISITNNGAAVATGIIVNAGLPDGMAYTNSSTSVGEYNLYYQEWTIDELAAGETAVLNLELFTLVSNQPITNFVQIFVANELDPDSTPGNNTTGIPAEDDEAAVTIQIDAMNFAGFPQMEFVQTLNIVDAAGKPVILPHTAYANNMSTSNLLAASTKLTLAPNPFISSTTFEVQLTKGGVFELEVFEVVTGKTVSVQTIELQRGVNRFNYNGSQLPSGCYTYQLSNTDGFVSGKMIVIE